MEKKMEKMKKEIKTQNRFYLIIAALFLIAQCTNTSGVLTSAYTNPHSAEFVHGFVLGLVIVVEIFVILQFCKNSKALASQKSVQIALILAVAAGFIVCYFSLEAFLGMLGVVILTGVVRKCCKIYYTRTYTLQ